MPPRREETTVFAATSVHESMRAQPAPVRTITLLDLVSELVDAGGSDHEVVTAVMNLVETRRVRLIGQVREADLRVRV